ncbi:MAG: hypothetical protein Kow0089_17040 [Desulfobulbaceae bacterium]
MTGGMIESSRKKLTLDKKNPRGDDGKYMFSCSLFFAQPAVMIAFFENLSRLFFVDRKESIR